MKRRTFTEKNNDRKQFREVVPARMPLGMFIEPTNRCNFSCAQCSVSLPEFKEITKEQGHMDMALYEKIINEIVGMGRLRSLSLFGDGEPFLNPNIVEMIRIARKRNASDTITITTNASLLNDKTSEEVIKSGLDYLRVSVYSIYEERFRRITQTKLQAAKIYENVRRFRQIRDELKSETPFLYVKMINTYSEENEEFKALYNGIADQINIETPMNWTGYKGIDLISKIDPGRKTDETLVQGYHVCGDTLQSGYKKICTMPFITLNVKRDGVVCICIVDWNRGTCVGNIAEESLRDIWYGDRLRQFREMHIRQRRHENPSCKNCKFLYSNPDNMDDFTEEEYQEILNYKEDDSFENLHSRNHD